MSRAGHIYHTLLKRWHLSLFEKVILVNSILLLSEALAGLWVTSHNLEAHHYLIDTSFIVFATLLSLLANIFLLRASFRPLFGLLSTMRKVSAGQTQERALITHSDPEIGELAQVFNTMLDRLDTARREQAMLIIQAQEEEQRRIALELHDEAGQNLTALLIHTELLGQSFQALPAAAVTEDARRMLNNGLLQLTKLTQDTLENIRVLAQQLRPSVLDDLGLHAAFRWLAEDGRQRLQLKIVLHLDDRLAEHFPPGYETALFRIAQESLTNIARHAHAEHISISLMQDQEHIRLQIQDDGYGYDSAQQQAGLGIFGMTERATLLGGTLTIHSKPAQGTTIQACLPVPTTDSREKNDA